MLISTLNLIKIKLSIKYQIFLPSEYGNGRKTLVTYVILPSGISLLC